MSEGDTSQGLYPRGLEVRNILDILDILRRNHAEKTPFGHPENKLKQAHKHPLGRRFCSETAFS